MHQVNLSDDLYQDARRRAAEAGFSSVDEYVAEVLSHDIKRETPNLDHFFTPERLALIDESLADVKAGNVLSMGQATTELAKSRDAWLRDHPDAK